jgi:hypothetical protein
MPGSRTTPATTVLVMGRCRSIRGPLATAAGTILVLTVLADNDTWTVAVAAMAADRLLKALRHNQTWERVVRSIPHIAHWIDREPLGDVAPMAGVMDRYRRFVVDDQPVVTVWSQWATRGCAPTRPPGGASRSGSDMRSRCEMPFVSTWMIRLGWRRRPTE